MLDVVFMFRLPKKFPPTNESRRREGTDVEPFAEASVLILLATETIGERFCCCQGKSCCGGQLCGSGFAADGFGV